MSYKIIVMLIFHHKYTHIFTFIPHSNCYTPGKYYNYLFIPLGSFGQYNT